MADKKLESLRKNIDKVDENLLNILAKRMKIVEKIGTHKKEKHLSPRDNKRWEEILETRIDMANKLKLNEEFIKKFYNLMHEYSLKIEKEIK